MNKLYLASSFTMNKDGVYERKRISFDEAKRIVEEFPVAYAHYRKSCVRLPLIAAYMSGAFGFIVGYGQDYKCFDRLESGDSILVCSVEIGESAKPSEYVWHLVTYKSFGVDKSKDES